MKRLMLFAGMALLSLCMAVSVQAAVLGLVPGQDGHAYIHVGDPPNDGTGTPTYLYNGETVAISETKLSIFNNSGAAILDPMWLILGIPNVDGTYSAPLIDSVSIGTVVGGPAYAGSLTAGLDLYKDILGIQGGGSQSFVNWNIWQDAVNGFTANNYGIFVYEIDMNAPHLGDKEATEITFGSALELGTYAVGVGLLEIKTNPQGKTTYTYATTPFTETGLLRKVPEPASFLLIGMGLIGMGLFRRKK